MKSKIKNKSVCIGAGLIALDIVINGNPKVPLKIFAGGSCGNVLTILSYLEWEALPIARLKNNGASKEIIKDIKRWKVNTSLISQTSDGSTPIIIQRIRKDKDGNSMHNFQFKNPDNGEWLPSFKPVLSKNVYELTIKYPSASVFYFDRVSRSSIELAKYYKDHGAVIFFEPSSFQDTRQFEECLEVAHIIKFSNERIKNYSEIFNTQKVPLEIITLGKEGIKYRYSKDLRQKKWTKLSSFKIPYVVDSAGSGDWFSAGIISKLLINGITSFENCDILRIEKAMNYGQALGALNCFFEGARGLMYQVEMNKISSLIELIINRNDPFSRNDIYNDTRIPQRKINISSLY